MAASSLVVLPPATAVGMLLLPLTDVAFLSITVAVVVAVRVVIPPFALSSLQLLRRRHIPPLPPNVRDRRGHPTYLGYGQPDSESG